MCGVKKLVRDGFHSNSEGFGGNFHLEYKLVNVSTGTMNKREGVMGCDEWLVSSPFIYFLRSLRVCIDNEIAFLK